jgi:23S rRNA U2552 (ribose-2'-O)-methylase RlmE/FtsJ
LWNKYISLNEQTTKSFIHNCHFIFMLNMLRYKLCCSFNQSIVTAQAIWPVSSATCCSMLSSIGVAATATTYQIHRLSTTSFVNAQKSGSSQRWLQRQRDDIYAKNARMNGYRTRSAYKLLAINDKHRFLVPGARCIDCGSNPGGWSQVAAELILRNSVKPGISRDLNTSKLVSVTKQESDTESIDNGLVVAVDLLPMPPLTDVHFIQGDFSADEIQSKIVQLLDHTPVDVVLSDMAPSLSGRVDHTYNLNCSYLLIVLIRYSNNRPS